MKRSIGIMIMGSIVTFMGIIVVSMIGIHIMYSSVDYFFFGTPKGILELIIILLSLLFSFTGIGILLLKNLIRKLALFIIPLFIIFFYSSLHSRLKS